jgi:hypothetical protein
MLKSSQFLRLGKNKMNQLKIAYFFFSLIFTLISCKSMPVLPENQLTFDLDYNHDLDNNDNFSPDDQWLVYDTRTDEGGIAISSKIEKVHVNTGEKKVLYALKANSKWGPGVGAVSYSPIDFSVVFIHGLMNSSEENPYQQWRRTGVIIDEKNPNVPIYMDARDVDFPFTAGALRGGTHRHEFSGDGNWIGFTYNDAIMQSLEAQTGKKHNLRTIGVAKKNHPVKVDSGTNGENNSGDWFSALVVHVVASPTAGSDEISQALGDSWVGKNGYPLAEGGYQMARSFIGTVNDANGKPVDEVFLVTIPKEINQNGSLGPLEGTLDHMPFPPKGVTQKRLTFTSETPYPGCAGIVRSDLMGQNMAFLAYDANGIRQVFTISPNGGKPQQITKHDKSVTSSLRWHPSGKSIFYVYAGKIVQCQLGSDAFENRMQYLTAKQHNEPTNIVLSHDGKTLAFNRKVLNSKSQETKQIFTISLP